MSDVQAQFSVLRQTADPAVADAIALLIEKGEDHQLNRINVLDFSKQTDSTKSARFPDSFMRRGLVCST